MARAARTAVAIALVVAACGAGTEGGGPSPMPPATGPPFVRVVLVGDVMPGRGLRSIVAGDPHGLFEGIRYVVAGADLAAANLESPLTDRPLRTDNPNDLRADPTAAGLLAEAGFDVVNLANNHADDAGAAGIGDAERALAAAGITTIGAGADPAGASAARILEHDGIRVAFLGFDATRGGWSAAGGERGVAGWDERTIEAAIRRTRDRADLVIVSVHGGIEYLTDPDPRIDRLAGLLVAWGADVVWGHGAHVAQPVRLAPGGAVVATDLGNLLFDQGAPGTTTGTVLEVLADATGPVAFRVGSADHGDRRVRFTGWTLPGGDAALLGGEWWTPARHIRPAAAVDRPDTGAFRLGEVVDASLGDLTGDGAPELVVSYRHDERPHPVRDAFPDHPWTDADGRTAHLGVFPSASDPPLWAGGALFRPIAGVAACDGSVALAFGDPGAPVVATAAWRWNGFGFDVPEELPGPGTPGCADVDGDGRLDPVVVGRQADAPGSGS